MNIKKIIKRLLCVLLLVTSVAKSQKPLKSRFPGIAGPVQVTNSNKEHLFASYYGINPRSKKQRFITVLDTRVWFKIPDENEPPTLGLVNLKTNAFIPLTQTRAWNFQQGCMTHWLATNPDSLLFTTIYATGNMSL